MEDGIAARLSEMGVDLPGQSNPAANYSNSVRTGNLLFISGKSPLETAGKLPHGKLGKEFGKDEGKELCKSACINLLAAIKQDIGSLDRIARFVELQGFLNTTVDFEDHATVMDGASDLLFRVFGGEKGSHARSVLGATSLRKGIPVVLRAVVELEP